MNYSNAVDSAEVDALLEVVSTQITLHTFDASDLDTLQRLVEALGDSRGTIRLRVAETLGEIGEPANPLLLDALGNHPNVVVRRAAAKTLTLIANPVGVPNLIHALLHDEDTVVKGSSVGALARMGEAAVQPLLDILANPDLPQSTKGHAAWALAFIGAEAKQYLLQAIASDSEEVRMAVVGAISKVAQENPESSDIELLVRALSDHSTDVRCEAASALGNLAYKPAIPTLLDLLHHGDWETRKAAALALMKMGDRTTIEPLQVALDHEAEIAVKTVIQLAISQIERKAEDSE